MSRGGVVPGGAAARWVARNVAVATATGHQPVRTQLLLGSSPGAGCRLQAAMCVRAGLTSQLQLLLLPFLFSDFFYLFCCGLCTCKCRITGSVRSVITLFCGHVLWALGEWKERKEGEPWSTPFAFTIEGMRCFAWSGRCVLWARRRPCRRVVGSAAARRGASIRFV